MPQDVPAAAVRDALFVLWDEILGRAGPGAEPHVLDPDAGWASTLAAVDAATASLRVAPDGTSVAGQTAHAALALAYLEDILDGRATETDWPASFLPAEVDPIEWDLRRERLLAVADRVGARLRADPSWTHDHLLRIMSHVVHLAYHLGAVRQMVRAVRG